MKHADEAEDKKLIKSMMKKANPVKKKVAKHLKKDIKEQAKGIKEDLALMKSMKKR